jgi:hypothetical protein
VVHFYVGVDTPRQVIEQTLAGSLRRSVISTLFGGSGSFYESPKDEFDVLVVDEAHRLNEKSGLFSNLGENQVSEIIRASRCAIFFNEEDQRVTWKDVGSAKDIAARAVAEGAEVTRLQLESQFRCSGSDGHLAWLDDVLGIRPTANPLLDPRDYDFPVNEDPNDQAVQGRAAAGSGGGEEEGGCDRQEYVPDVDDAEDGGGVLSTSVDRKTTEYLRRSIPSSIERAQLSELAESFDDYLMSLNAATSSFDVGGAAAHNSEGVDKKRAELKGHKGGSYPP